MPALTYTTNFPGTAISSWDGGAWAARGATADTFNNPGLTTTLDNAEGYVVRLGAIGIDALRDFEAELAITSLNSTGTMFGPAIHDDTGLGAISAWYNAPVGDLILRLVGYSYPSTFQNGGGTPAFPSRLKTIYTASTGVYTTSYSTNGGATWSTPSAGIVPGGIPTTVGFGNANGTAATATVSEFIVRGQQIAAPSAPSGLVLQPYSTGIRASWNAAVEGGTAASYDIRINGGSPVSVASGTSYTFTGLSTTTSHTVEVRAVNYTGSSAWLSATRSTATAYAFDTFTRANSTGSAGTPDEGAAYTARLGTWGIISNQLYTSASTGFSVLSCVSASADFEITCEIPVVVANAGGGIVWRWTDNSNFWMLREQSGGFWGVWRRVAGSFVFFGTVGNRAGVNGDRITVAAQGVNQWILLNGIVQLWIEDLFAQTTTHGLLMDGSTGGRVDNFSCVPFSVIPGGVHNTAAGVASGAGSPATPGFATSFLYKGRLTRNEDLVGAG